MGVGFLDLAKDPVFHLKNHQAPLFTVDQKIGFVYVDFWKVLVEVVDIRLGHPLEELVEGLFSLCPKLLDVSWIIMAITIHLTNQIICSNLGQIEISKLNSNPMALVYKFKEKIKTTPKLRGCKEIKDSHVNRVLAGLRRIFNFAVHRELLEESMNPFPKTPKSGLIYPETRGRRNFFTENQILAIYQTAPEWMKPLVAISYYTGMRRGEVRKLRWEYINMEAGIVQLPESKTLKDPSGVGQRIVMQKELIDLLKNLPHRSDDWFFVKADGLPYQHWDIHKPFKALLKSLGIDTDKFSWKDIRHTTGTLLHLKGADPLAIKDQLRHTTMHTTESFYIGSDVEYQRSQIQKLSLKQGNPNLS